MYVRSYLRMYVCTCLNITYVHTYVHTYTYVYKDIHIVCTNTYKQFVPLTGLVYSQVQSTDPLLQLAKLHAQKY